MSAKARNTDPRYSTLAVGTAPDSWGVWFPEDDKQVGWQTFLDEVAEAGYEYIETGPFGFLPTDPETLRAECARRGITVVAGTQFGVLHRDEDWDQTEKDMRANAEVLKALGAKFLVYLPPMLRDLQTGGWAEDPNLTDEEWARIARNANKLGKLLKEDYGVTMAVHPHGDSHIETREQIDRFFSETDPEYVSFCLDTGHLEYGEVDTVDLIKTYPDRIGIVHIKQMDPEVVQRVRAEDLSFGEAVSLGVCVTPDGGQPKVGAVIDALADLEKDLYVIVEQDLYPCAPDVPLPLAIETRKVLAENNLGLL
ncbi:MAG: TIM barrel protein [Tessaracoccus sp.]|uniref:sugar phosphate isomerase/epimerase family protein n=1 Tax=Tessaracoccus sp. TaxID=1971211 RepID=UPI001ED3C392|nr:sugar phosphate isomerase/epimerase [Tessaracoccus sp.]MBK7819775.1 TIM barrel protein [Tessaracoccus sp.]